MSSLTPQANIYSPAGQIVQPQSVGKYKETLMGKNGPAVYVTGGVPLTAEEVELTWINFVYISTSLAGTHRANVIYPDNSGPNKQVLLLITDMAGTEIGNGVDLSAQKFRIHSQGEY